MLLQINGLSTQATCTVICLFSVSVEYNARQLLYCWANFIFSPAMLSNNFLNITSIAHGTLSAIQDKRKKTRKGGKSKQTHNNPVNILLFISFIIVSFLVSYLRRYRFFSILFANVLVVGIVLYKFDYVHT